MNFKNMNFKPYTDVNIISVTPDCDIKVLKYLPIEEKNDLIALTIQNSDENGFYNPVKLKMFLELYTVYLYTDIEFDENDKLDEIMMYNILKGNGILDAVINTIPDEEWNELNMMYYDYLTKKEKYRGSIAGVINSFIENLAPNAENAAKIINNFNPEMFQNVIQFAQAANGNRPIQ